MYTVAANSLAKPSPVTSYSGLGIVTHLTSSYSYRKYISSQPFPVAIALSGLPDKKPEISKKFSPLSRRYRII